MLRRWFTPLPRLDPQQESRLSVWRELQASGQKTSLEKSRCVVLDVETTGLNLMKDTLISIGAVAVVKGRIVLEDSFYVVLQQRESSRKENILIHGISGSEQREGESPADALLAFLEYLGNDPLVAFHVKFDETMISRAVRQYLGFLFEQTWLDLAYVLPALFPNLMYSHRGLDDWSRHFNIGNEDRHNAVADALATAQLMLVAINMVRNTSDSGYEGLRSLERTFRHASGKE